MTRPPRFTLCLFMDQWRAFRVAIRATALLLLLASLTIAAHAQVGTPIDLGSNQADPDGPFPLTITTTRTAPQGSSIIVIATEVNQGEPAIGLKCSDSAGHPYNNDIPGLVNSGTNICSTATIAAPLASGSTITVTFFAIAGAAFERAHAFAIPGLASSPLDQTAFAASTSASPSSGATPITTQAQELLFSGIVVDTNVSTAGFSPGTNGTSQDCAAAGTPVYSNLGGISTQNPPSLFSMYCVVSAKGSYAAQASLATSNNWEALLATYKADVKFTATALTGDVSEAAVGQTVTFTATVTKWPGLPNNPSGNVTFKDNTFNGPFTLGTAVLNSNGVAVFSTNTLSFGEPHSITAIYGGDSNYNGSTSAAFFVTIHLPPALLITANPPSLSLTSGQSGTVALTITGNGSNPVTVNCLAVTISCSVSSPVVGQNSTTATLTIDTGFSHAASTPAAPTSGSRIIVVVLGGLLPAAILLVPIRARKRAALGGLLLAVVLILGCGDSGPKPSTGVPPGTYSVAVSASSGGVSGATNVGVTVH